jgi:hypothetical protein
MRCQRTVLYHQIHSDSAKVIFIQRKGKTSDISAGDEWPGQCGLAFPEDHVREIKVSGKLAQVFFKIYIFGMCQRNCRRLNYSSQ